LPSPGGKTATPRIINFTILVEAFLLYITMHSVFPPLEEVFLKIGQCWVDFAPPSEGSSGRGKMKFKNFVFLHP
jgi:hypothetical protein